MTIGLIDIIVLITIVLSILFALYRGLVCELLGISSWILAGLGALYMYSPMQKIMGGMIDDEKLAGIAGSALVALTVLIIMTIVNSQITNRLRQSSLSGLDRTLGLIFGVLRALLLIALVYIGAATFLPEAQIRTMAQENISIPYIQKIARLLEHFVPKNVQADLDIYEQEEKQSQKKQKIGPELKRAKPLPKQSPKKAIDSFIKELSKPQNESIPSPTPKQPTPVYNAVERQSLDNMVEKLTEEN